MVLTRKWTASANNISVTFECPFYNELLGSENPETGRLSRDYEAHALWQYLGMAFQTYERAKKNLVEESERSLVFDQEFARNMFKAVAQNHNVRPERMVRFWDMINRQRLALGGGDDLPEEFKFRYWGH